LEQQTVIAEVLSGVTVPVAVLVDAQVRVFGVVVTLSDTAVASFTQVLSLGTVLTAVPLQSDVV